MRTAALSFLLSISILSFGQRAFTVKFFGLTMHPGGDPTAHLQPYKLDDEAKFVMNYGGFIGYEKFIYEDLVSLKAIQGFMSDCSAGFASVSHLGVRANIINTTNHKLYFGIGPTVIVRESWSRFGDDYESSGYFNERQTNKLGDLQWKMIPYAFEFEYDYALSQKDQISLSVTPGVPIAILVSVGWKHWIEIKEYPTWKYYTPKKKTK
ncbi:MAG: hypothetical protein ACPGTP_01845 [Bacteroidia bacterium]